MRSERSVLSTDAESFFSMKPERGAAVGGGVGGEPSKALHVVNGQKFFQRRQFVW